MIQTLEPILRQHPFFQGMAEDYIKFIAGCSMNVRFEAGQIIFHEGDPADHFYLIREGMVSAQLAVPNRGLTTVLTVGSGEVFGWSWLFPPYRWHFEGRAQQPTHALAFDGKCLRAKCEQDHDLGYDIYKRFMRIVTERLEATRLQLLDVYGKHA